MQAGNGKMRALMHVILCAFITDTMLERRPCLTQTLRRVRSESSVDDVMCIISFRPLQLPSVWSLLLSDVTLHHGEIKGIAIGCLQYVILQLKS